MSRTKAALAACALALGFSGAALAKTINQGQSSSGKTLRVHKGDLIRITLGGASGSTGYSWSQASRPAYKVLRLLSVTTKQVNCPPHVVGCPENTTYVYKARGKGKTRINLVLTGPVRGTPPAKRFVETVIVK